MKQHTKNATLRQVVQQNHQRGKGEKEEGKLMLEKKERSSFYGRQPKSVDGRKKEEEEEDEEQEEEKGSLPPSVPTHSRTKRRVAIFRLPSPPSPPYSFSSTYL